jgi:hypothetical protein
MFARLHTVFLPNLSLSSAAGTVCCPMPSALANVTARDQDKTAWWAWTLPRSLLHRSMQPHLDTHQFASRGLHSYHGENLNAASRAHHLRPSVPHGARAEQYKYLVTPELAEKIRLALRTLRFHGDYKAQEKPYALSTIILDNPVGFPLLSQVWPQSNRELRVGLRIRGYWTPQIPAGILDQSPRTGLPSCYADPSALAPAILYYREDESRIASSRPFQLDRPFFKAEMKYRRGDITFKRDALISPEGAMALLHGYPPHRNFLVPPIDAKRSRRQVEREWINLLAFGDLQLRIGAKGIVNNVYLRDAQERRAVRITFDYSLGATPYLGDATIPFQQTRPLVNGWPVLIEVKQSIAHDDQDAALPRDVKEVFWVWGLLDQGLSKRALSAHVFRLGPSKGFCFLNDLHVNLEVPDQRHEQRQRQPRRRRAGPLVAERPRLLAP